MINVSMYREEFAIMLKRKWPVWLLLAAVFFLAVFLGGREFWRWYGINQEYQTAKNKVSDFEQQLQELTGELSDLARPEVLEKEARAKLNFKKEGESVLVVVGGDNFPKEDFLKAQAHSLFDNPSGIWFNIKSWLSYFNIKKIK